MRQTAAKVLCLLPAAVVPARHSAWPLPVCNSLMTVERGERAFATFAVDVVGLTFIVRVGKEGRKEVSWSVGWLVGRLVLPSVL